MAAGGTASDPLDRALRFREEGLFRKKLDELGLLQCNRGNLGISGHHMHEVAWSCILGVRANRYKQVEVVRVPESCLDDWRRSNKERCESDALMPNFSANMRFALLSKTHFTHANKLARDGNRSLFNEGKIPIKYEESNTEGNLILAEGIICSVYRSELWSDTDAMRELMAADNDDADIEMGEDEIQAQGRVESALNVCQQAGTAATVDAVFKEMKRMGTRAFSDDDTRSFIEFRLALVPGVAQCFRACVFHSVCGRVRVHPADYKLVSTLEPRAMWVKVPIMVRQYMLTLSEKFPPGHLLSITGFAGRA